MRVEDGKGKTTQSLQLGWQNHRRSGLGRSLHGFHGDTDEKREALAVTLCAVGEALLAWTPAACPCPQTSGAARPFKLFACARA